MIEHFLIAVFVLFLWSSLVFAAGPKTYQVTGPVLEIKQDVVIVQKGKEKGDILKTDDTKVNGDLRLVQR